MWYDIIYEGQILNRTFYVHFVFFPFGSIMFFFHGNFQFCWNQLNLAYQNVVVRCSQVLKALLHSYPSIVTRKWECISSVVYSLLQTPSTEFSPEVCSASWREEHGKALGSNIEKCTTAGVKVNIFSHFVVRITLFFT